MAGDGSRTSDKPTPSLLRHGHKRSNTHQRKCLPNRGHSTQGLEPSGNTGRFSKPGSVVQPSFDNPVNEPVGAALFLGGGQFLRVSLRHIEQHILTLQGDAKLHSVVFDKWENLLVGNGVLIPDDQEFLVVLHQLGDVIEEQRKRRIGHHDVRLLQKLDALRAAEIAVPPSNSRIPISPTSGTLPPFAFPLYSSHNACSESWPLNRSRSRFL